MRYVKNGIEFEWNIERFSSGPAAWTSRNAGPRWRFAVLDEAVGGPKGYGYYELLMPLKAVGGPRSSDFPHIGRAIRVN
jgi:hypothetical protein